MKEMSWMVGVLSLVIFLVTGCAEDRPSATFSGALERAQALEESHHAEVLSLDRVDAIRENTARYADGMHGALDDMESEYSRMMNGHSMMPGDHMQEMQGMIGEAGDMVGEHLRRMDAMEAPAEMKVECEEHHAAMQEAFSAMHDAMTGGETGDHAHH